MPVEDFLSKSGISISDFRDQDPCLDVIDQQPSTDTPLVDADLVPRWTATVSTPSATSARWMLALIGTVGPFGTAATTQPPEPIQWCQDLRTSKRFESFDHLREDLLSLISLRDNWDSYGAEPPLPGVIEMAREALFRLQEMDILPDAVVPSAEGGVGIVFVRSGRYADIELLNEGDTLMSTYYGKDAPEVYEFHTADQAVSKVRQYITS
jgi:hypothetical protein